MKRVIFIVSFLFFIGEPSLVHTLTLTVDSNTFFFSQPTKWDYDAGYLEAIQATELSISSEANWQITIRTDNSSLGGYGKPISDFLWRKSGGSYQPVTNANTVVDSGTAGSPAINMDYMLLLDWTEDKPGDYSLTLIYILTTP